MQQKSSEPEELLNKFSWERRVGNMNYKRTQMSFEIKLNKIHVCPRINLTPFIKEMNQSKGKVPSKIKSYGKVKSTKCR